MRSYFFRALTGVLALLSLSAVQAHDSHHDMAQHSAAQAPVYHARGIVKTITSQTLTVRHQAIPDLNWPPMTMQFELPPAVTLPAVKAGDSIQFSFVQSANGYQVVSLTPQD